MFTAGICRADYELRLNDEARVEQSETRQITISD
jgi:hypothetical protein